jgi:hypothetical protein
VVNVVYRVLLTDLNQKSSSRHSSLLLFILKRVTFLSLQCFTLLLFVLMLFVLSSNGTTIFSNITLSFRLRIDAAILYYLLMNTKNRFYIFCFFFLNISNYSTIIRVSSCYNKYQTFFFLNQNSVCGNGLLDSHGFVLHGMSTHAITAHSFVTYYTHSTNYLNLEINVLLWFHYIVLFHNSYCRLKL